MNNISRKIVVAFGTLVLLTTACSKKSSSGGDSGGTPVTTANIYGKVSTEGASLNPQGADFKPFGYFRKVSKFSAAGCTVTAYDIAKNSVVAEGTTAADGTYSISGLTNGVSYKLIATCGSTVLSVVATADLRPTTEKTPETTDATSTVIAAKVIQKIMAAIDDALEGLSDTLKDSIKAVILGQMDAIISSIKTAIVEAIESGAMEAPTDADATQVAGSLKDAKDSITAEAAISTYNDKIPESVNTAANGAQAQGLSMITCDSTKADSGLASLDKCTKSIIGLFYGSLKFPVMIKMANGAFGTIAACDKATLGDTFANARFDGTVTGWCKITPDLGQIDRNRGSDEHGGDDGGPLFAESGTLAGTEFTGVITAIASALFTNKVYNLNSIDKLIFKSSNGAGMNSRLFSQRLETTGICAGGKSIHYYNSATSAWVDTGKCKDAWSPTFDQNNDFWRFKSKLAAGGTWACSGTASPACTTDETNTYAGIEASDNSLLSVILKKFGGEMPAQNELTDFVNKGRVHLERNPSGQKEFYVLYTEQQKFNNDGSNPCWDNDPATICYGASGAEYPIAKFLLTLGAKDATSKFRLITSLSSSSIGNLYANPMWNMNGFSGIFTFVNTENGRQVVDEFFNQRAVKVILKSSECSETWASTLVGCAPNKFYNVSLDWSSCSGSTGCPNLKAKGTAAIDTSALTLPVQTSVKSKWVEFTSGQHNYGRNLVGSGNWNDMDNFKIFKVTINSGAITNGTFSSSGQASTSGDYNLTSDWVCSDWQNQSTCVNKMYFVDDNGFALPASTLTVSGATLASAGTFSIWSGTGTSVIVNNYTSDAITAVIPSFSEAVDRFVFNGPAPNPNWHCSLEPYFVDGNGDGVLNCAADDKSATSGDVAYGNLWEFKNWQNECNWNNQATGCSGSPNARSTTFLTPNTNGYAYGDPIGTVELYTTAFPGWFDGAHTMAVDTKLNSLQVFAYVFLFFTEGTDGVRPIEGLVTGQNQFIVESPYFRGGDGGGGSAQATHVKKATKSGKVHISGGGGNNPAEIRTINNIIGKAFTEFVAQ